MTTSLRYEPVHQLLHYKGKYPMNIMHIVTPRLYFIVLSFFIFTAGCSVNNTSNSEHSKTINQAATTYRSTTAEPRTIEHSWMSVAQWYKMHRNHIDIAQDKNPDLLFIGDSITESWAWGDGRDDVYKRYFSQYNAANFAIGGDMTQNLLWRLQHGLKGNISPKVAVLMIGTNNFLHQHQTPEEIAAGVKVVVEQLQRNYPNIKILTLGILPIHKADQNNSRQYVSQANTLIAQLADNQSVFFLNFGDKFLNKKNNIPKELMDDYIHPTAKGLEIVAKNVSPVLKSWLKK